MFGPGDDDDDNDDVEPEPVVEEESADIEEEDDDPGADDDDYRGEKDSGTFSRAVLDDDTGRIDIYWGERGSPQHGHLVTSDEGTAEYLRDEEGEVHRDT